MCSASSHELACQHITIGYTENEIIVKILSLICFELQNYKYKNVFSFFKVASSLLTAGAEGFLRSQSNQSC